MFNCFQTVTFPDELPVQPPKATCQVKALNGFQACFVMAKIIVVLILLY
jgi:hypothetical protein